MGVALARKNGRSCRVGEAGRAGGRPAPLRRGRRRPRRERDVRSGPRPHAGAAPPRVRWQDYLRADIAVRGGRPVRALRRRRSRHQRPRRLDGPPRRRRSRAAASGRRHHAAAHRPLRAGCGADRAASRPRRRAATVHRSLVSGGGVLADRRAVAGQKHHRLSAQAPRQQLADGRDGVRRRLRWDTAADSGALGAALPVPGDRGRPGSAGRARHRLSNRARGRAARTREALADAAQA